MQYFLRLLLKHGYLLLFVVVLGQEAGAPIPADPFMIGMGALAGDGHFSMAAAILLAWTAALTGDLVWFQIGRIWGARALRLLCRIAIEPDSCVRSTQSRFRKRGPKSLVLAKFLPGLSAMATPVAGMTGTPLGQFLLWDGLGSLLWVSLYLTVGSVFRRRLEELAAFLSRATRSAGILVVLLVALYIGYKLFRRRRFLKSIAKTIIQPEDVHGQLASGAPLVLVDLREPEEVEDDPFKLPGALLWPPADLMRRYSDLPDGHDIVLYCSCPNEGSSGKMSLEK